MLTWTSGWLKSGFHSSSRESETTKAAAAREPNGGDGEQAGGFHLYRADPLTLVAVDLSGGLPVGSVDCPARPDAGGQVGVIGRLDEVAGQLRLGQRVLVQGEVVV
jgi:hypothetical protein